MGNESRRDTMSGVFDADNSVVGLAKGFNMNLSMRRHRFTGIFQKVYKDMVELFAVNGDHERIFGHNKVAEHACFVNIALETIAAVRNKAAQVSGFKL